MGSDAKLRCVTVSIQVVWLQQVEAALLENTLIPPLMIPKEGQFDPFGQGLRGKLRRLMTRHNRFNSPGSREC
jgi:hypothetical protein